MRNPQFVNGHIYHVYNRGVEKRRISVDDRDRLRFTLGLQVFNDTAPTLNETRGLGALADGSGFRSKRRGKKLVELLVFTLMPNHYHLMLRQLRDGGITEFMRKLGTGYTNYFNLRQKRVGSLFQGKFKAVLLEDEAHFLYLPHYIHCNSLELSLSKLHARSVSEKEFVAAALEELVRYRWSSLRDYFGIETFPTVTDRQFFTECIGLPRKFRARTRRWLFERVVGPRGRRRQVFVEHFDEKTLETPQTRVRLRRTRFRVGVNCAAPRI